MSGAVRMAARAAFAAGAGLVHAVAPPETVAALVQAEPDLQTLAHPFDQPPPAALLELVARADCRRHRPGPRPRAGPAQAHRRPGARRRERWCSTPTRWWHFRAPPRSCVSLPRTLPGAHAASRRVPHAVSRAGGAARARSLGARRRRRPSETGAVVLLKGVPTVVALARATAPHRRRRQPRARHRRQRRCAERDRRRPNLASGLEPDIAAALGAQVLGRAADIAARRSTARSLRPMDVVAALPDLWREWEVLRTARAGATPARPVRAAPASDRRRAASIRFFLDASSPRRVLADLCA